MRKTLGQVCYPRAEQAFEDPDKEASRREIMMKWRRKQLAINATSHVRRIVREDGLARTIEELHDKQGRPPPNVDVGKMVKQYKRLKRQYGWLTAIADSCREMLREIDLVRFIKDNAQIEQDLLDRKASREGVFRKAAEDARGDKELPPKLVALIRTEIKRDIRRKEIRNARPNRSGDFHLSMARRMQDIMQFLFLEHVPEGVAPEVAYDPEYRYEFLFDALKEIEVLIDDLRSNLYELSEYVESADLFVMRYE